jgi:acetoacetate decarboxylase
MGSAELKPGVRYDMPPGFGPSVAPDVEDDFDLHGSNIEFETTAEALAPLLPRWFRPTPRPIVSIGYRRMLGMRWMGGRDYQIVRVGVSVECDAAAEKTANSFGLVIWESDCAPILAGRELMGAPKLFGHIPAIEVGAHDHSFECREYDALLIRGHVTQLRELNPDEVAKKRELQRQSWVYYWKYIPGVQGEPDANYPVAIKLATPFTRIWQGRAALELGAPSVRDAPYSHHILKRLAELPRRSELSSSAWHAAGCALFRDQTRRLDL